MKALKLFLCVFAGSFCHAQMPQCYVSTITGSASVIHNAKTSVLKKGDFIFKADTIIAKPAAVVTLIDYTNKILTLNKAGKFTYADLQKSLVSKSTGITEAYFKFIWEDLFKPEAREAISPRNIGGATGGASRNACDLMVSPLNSSKFSDDTLFFNWHTAANTKLYKFTLVDKSKNDIINILTKDTTVAILKKDLLQAETTAYYWKVSAGSNNCAVADSYFTITSVPEKDKEVTAILNAVSNDGDAFIYNLKVSDILAQKGWHKQAFDYYIKAKQTLFAAK